ncbi:MAG: SpoIID/LytB domain-containing protein [Deltaproteobacteria bacterium]|nr:SpoIID/LytB domain-containing protein [Deltaproteobacteria bacterium]
MRGERLKVRGQRPKIGSRAGFHCLLFTVYCSLLFLSSCAGGKPISTSLYNGEKIRIAVLKGVKESKIGGGAHLSLVKLGKSGGITVNDSIIAESSVTFLPDNGVIYLNGRPFRGKIDVIKDGNGLLVVNELPLEFYVAGLINHEISSKWPIEAVKAQAVIARTYALYQKKKRGKGLYHMEATVTDQVYAGSTAEDDRSLYAVKETVGEVVTYDGEPALTVYHSNGGGMTEDPQNVWGKDYPYLKQVESPFDKDAPNFFWTLNISPQAVEAALKNVGYQVSGVQDITPLYTTNSGRVAKIRVRHGSGELEMSGEELRKTIGYDKLKSTMFTVEMVDGLFVFSGKGSGHGVGLSQWGAKGMAEKGYSYAEILKHFYPGTRIERIY